MKISLENKNILVTGGSRGIGAAVVQMLAQSGANIGLHYRKEHEMAEKIKSAYPDQITLFQADLADLNEVKQLVQNAFDHFNRIDVLVNNAGLCIEADLETEDEERWLEAWDITQDVNLRAAAYLSKALIPHFKINGGGRLIHISSRAGIRGDVPEYLAYAASKAGMIAMSRSLARYYGKDGIKSFVITPGFTKTDMAQQFIDTFGEGIVLNDLALNELTTPEDIAPTVVFLASGLMDHATGCTIDINAGSYVH